ncbi:MAG: site-specific DNA-methyltransferase [Atopobiaceae bacterium]|nr:site-specific DNA-methyltransferase [Atopobiaceae bacterium]
MTYEIVNGECQETMCGMDENSVDAIVCDPPYALAFMGNDWDSYGGGGGNESASERREKSHDYASENPGAPRYGNSHGHAPRRDENVAFQEQMTPIFAQALRVAKPGAHLLAFGSPRTFHRLFCAIEDAGWIVKDCVSWNYSSGFPKGLNVSKSVEALTGNADDVERWQGWNTQIKPAWEPICLAYKPLDGTVARNVMKWGVGALNIDACRVPTDQPPGRFPANFVHDGSDEVRECFPDAKGQQGDLRAGIPKRKGVCYGDFPPTNEHLKRDEPDANAARFFPNMRDGEESADRTYGDRGVTDFDLKPGMRREPPESYDRFFYCAKASKSDRGSFNTHSTVKPTALMQWLVRLVCPKDGVVLDPFCGSGSTGVACMREQMRFVGIDQEPEYCEMAERRIREECERGVQLNLF